jgi:flagellin-like protein
MLRKIFKQKRYFKNIYKSQKGITGLETAIILIAFVVVAAVFAYTVLSAGLFSTQKSQEAVYNGLAETQATMVVKGAVLAEALTKFTDTMDAEATTMSVGALHSTISQDTVTYNQGTGSMKIVTASAVADDILAVSKIAYIATLVKGDVVTFWAKTDGDCAVTFGIDTTATITAGADKVALSAAHTEWQQYSFTVSTSGSYYYGLYATGASSDTLYIDDVQVTPYADDIQLTLALPTGGNPVDFTAGTDGDNDGLFSGSTNKIVVNYNDAYTHLADVAWSGTFIGNNNNDRMLDPGEKIKLTIALKGITGNKVDANHQFTLEVKSPKGAILSLQRTMPARLYTINDLN